MKLQASHFFISEAWVAAVVVLGAKKGFQLILRSFFNFLQGHILSFKCRIPLANRPSQRNHTLPLIFSRNYWNNLESHGMLRIFFRITAR